MIYTLAAGLLAAARRLHTRNEGRPFTPHTRPTLRATSARNE